MERALKMQLLTPGMETKQLQKVKQWVKHIEREVYTLRSRNQQYCATL